MSEFECPVCDKVYKTRSGLRKHILSKHPVEESEDTEGGSNPTHVEEHYESDSFDPSTSSDEDWLDFTFDEEPSSESLPPVLKVVAKKAREPPKKKLTKAEQKIQSDSNIAILKMGLTGVDGLITKYGQAVTLDESYECSHSDSDKTIVARAQWEYLKEKGLDMTNYLSTGGVALALTGWYVVPPVYQIQKRKKRSVFGKTARVGRGLLSRIPLIGRFFKPKESQIVEVEADKDE